MFSRDSACETVALNQQRAGETGPRQTMVRRRYQKSQANNNSFFRIFLILWGSSEYLR